MDRVTGEKHIPDLLGIQQAVASQRDWAVDILGNWVRHGSVLGSEGSAQEYIASVYESLGLETRMVRITNAGLRESHPHDVVITTEAPNYEVVR